MTKIRDIMFDWATIPYGGRDPDTYSDPVVGNLMASDLTPTFSAVVHVKGREFIHAMDPIYPSTRGPRLVIVVGQVRGMAKSRLEYVVCSDLVGWARFEACRTV